MRLLEAAMKLATSSAKRYVRHSVMPDFLSPEAAALLHGAENLRKVDFGILAGPDFSSGE